MSDEVWAGHEDWPSRNNSARLRGPNCVHMPRASRLPPRVILNPRYCLGASSAGLLEKNPLGEILKLIDSDGMTGKSSGRGTWVNPVVYHTTTSSPVPSDSAGEMNLGRSLVGVVASGVALTFCVARDPKLVRGKERTLQWRIGFG